MYTREHQRLLSIYKNQNKQTEHEVLFENILKEFNIKYMSQKGFVAKCYSCFIADFYIPKPYKIIFEIDGPYHKHRNDAGRDWFFKHKRDITTYRFTNEQVENPDYIRKTLTEIFYN